MVCDLCYDDEVCCQVQALQARMKELEAEFEDALNYTKRDSKSIKHYQDELELMFEHNTKFREENTKLQCMIAMAKEELSEEPPMFVKTRNYYYTNADVRISRALAELNNKE